MADEQRKAYLLDDNHNNTKQKKRPIRNTRISIEFTKAVIICSSSELMNTESNTYRPNNIVIELLKKNSMRYGKVTFYKVSSEKEIRDDLSSKFPLLRNKIFSFASADQYGKFNFHQSEEWSGRNLRRWLPGSSAMYLIVQDDIQIEEPISAGEEPKGTFRKSSSCGILYTTARADASDNTVPSCGGSNPQPALLECISSPEKANLYDERVKMLAVDFGDPKPHKLHEALNRSFCPVRCVSPTAKKERVGIGIDISSRVEDLSNDSFDHLDFPLKRESNSLSCSDSATYLMEPRAKCTRLNVKVEAERNLNADASKETCKTVLQRGSLGKVYGGFQKNFIILASKEELLSKDSGVPVSNFENGLLSTKDKQSMESTSYKSNANRNYVENRKIPQYFSPFDMWNPLQRRGTNQLIASMDEQSEERQCQNSLEGYRDPMQTYLVSSSKCFPRDKFQQDGNNCHVMSKLDKRVFVPMGFVPRYVANVSGILPYLPINGSQTSKTIEDETWKTVDHMSNNLGETNVELLSQDEIYQVDNSLDSSLKKLNTETNKDGLRKCSQNKSPVNLVGQFLESSKLEEPPKNDKHCKAYCDITPCRGPCDGGGAPFVVSFEQPHDVFYIQTPLFAEFAGISTELAWINPFTLRGKAIPNSLKPGRETVHIQTADGQLIGTTSYTYVDDFVDGLSRVIFSRKYGEILQRVITSSDPGRPTKMQDELRDILELLVYLSAQKNSKSLIDKILNSEAGESVKDQFSKRSCQPHHVALDNGHVELSDYIEKQLYRCDSGYQRPLGAEEKANIAELDSGNDFEEKADNLILLSSIAIRMGKDTSNDSNSADVSRCCAENDEKTSRVPLEDCSEFTTPDDQTPTNSSSLRLCKGFLKKVFILPPNSLYLPSQSELCTLRATRSSYFKVQFDAEMSEDDVMDQIRKAFPDVKDLSFHLAVVDQTGKLVFYDGIWTGKVIRRKLRGNSVLYVVPINSLEHQSHQMQRFAVLE